MVTLVNRSRTQQVINLPHADYCTKESCACSTVEQQSIEVLPDGTKGIKVSDRRVASSVTILAGESGTYDDRIAKVPDVKAALDAKAIRLIQHPAKVEAVQPPSQSSSPQPPQEKNPGNLRSSRRGN